jgi:hypothetical protein
VSCEPFVSSSVTGTNRTSSALDRKTCKLYPSQHRSNTLRTLLGSDALRVNRDIRRM